MSLLADWRPSGGDSGALPGRPREHVAPGGLPASEKRSVARSGEHALLAQAAQLWGVGLQVDSGTHPQLGGQSWVALSVVVVQHVNNQTDNAEGVLYLISTPVAETGDRLPSGADAAADAVSIGVFLPEYAASEDSASARTPALPPCSQVACARRPTPTISVEPLCLPPLLPQAVRTRIQ